MGQIVRRIYIRKEALKFSAAHMTVFSNGSKEALHGHNYFTEVVIGLTETGFEEMVSFSVFKNEIKKMCFIWDEKILLARNCPFMQMVIESDQEIEFLLTKKRYVLPADEVVFLPVQNVTSEALSELFCLNLVARFKLEKFFHLIQEVQVKIEETSGQGASFIWEKS